MSDILFNKLVGQELMSLKMLSANEFMYDYCDIPNEISWMGYCQYNLMFSRSCVRNFGQCFCDNAFRVVDIHSQRFCNILL